MNYITEQAQQLRVHQFQEYSLHSGGTEVPLPTTYVVNNTAESHVKDGLVLFFEGLGEGDDSARHTMAVFDAMEVPAASVYMPFHSVPANSEDLTQVARELPNRFLDFILDQLDISAGERIAIGGHSLGGAVATLAAEKEPARYDLVLALRGLGLNRNDYLPTGGDPTQEELTDAADKLIRNLVIKNNKHAAQWPLHLVDGSLPIWDHGVVRGNAEVFANLAAPLKRGTLTEMIKAGLNLDLVDSVASLVEHGVDYRGYYGDRDPLFPFASADRNLGRVGLSHLLHKIPTSHNLLMSRRGTEALMFVAEDSLGGKRPVTQ
jgi:pimeloyl-ACP methyl ester carboxylesterase